MPGVDICPETGRSLVGKNRETYATNLWGIPPRDLRKLSPEAQQRYISVIGYNPLNIDNSPKKGGV